MLPGVAFWMVATAFTRTPPSPRTSPPKRDANSARVYPAPIATSVAVGLAALGLEVLLHLRQDLLGHIYRGIVVKRGIGDDHIVFLRLCEFLDGLDHGLLQLAELRCLFHVDVILV